MNIRKKIDYSDMLTAIDAAMSTEMPQMELYCTLGHLVSNRPEKGAAVAAAEYLAGRHPDATGFSPRNLRRMRDFYRMYEESLELLELAMEIGWTQNVVILEAELSMEERHWYLQAVKQFEWSKAELLWAIASEAHLELTLDESEVLCYTENEQNEMERTEHDQDTLPQKNIWMDDAMQTFKIFYSWQSDLPGSKTRSFIRECIDEAIELAQESEAIEAERDEATMGTTGSPDIVATLFSKIENCDLFIADLSSCYTEDQHHEKKSPNPNVMVELGYAVKTLGWERIICLCNTDYGNRYPFDIAHNRITGFSLEGKSRKEVKSDIAKIIFINIRDLRKQPPRAKDGMATHIIGAYSFADHAVVDRIVPIEISKQDSYTLHNEELLVESRKLLAEIQEMTDRMQATKKEEAKLREAFQHQPLPSVKTQLELPDAVHAMAESFRGTETPVVWEAIEDDKARIKHWLGADVTDEFFDVGGLKKTTSLFAFQGSSYTGTDNEKLKYKKLGTLSYNLLQLEVRTNYLKTFEGMCFIPLAIQNVSAIQDTDIRVVVQVETGEIVEPNEKLIWSEYDGLQGLLCRNDEDEADIGIICELFALTEDGTIHTEVIPVNPARYIPKVPVFTAGGPSQPNKTETDYKLELEEFIASTDGRGYYEFDIASLRPGECRWLCCGMLIKPTGGQIKVHYRIHSARSMGDLDGTLEMEMN